MKLIHKRKHNNKNAYLFMLPSLAGVLVLFVIPYFDVMRRSFMDGTGRNLSGRKIMKSCFRIRHFSWRPAIQPVL